jgi:hypothetical protein
VHVSEVYSVTPLPCEAAAPTAILEVATLPKDALDAHGLIRYDTPTCNGDLPSKVTGICSLLLAVPPADRNDWRRTGGKNRHMRRRVHFSTRQSFAPSLAPATSSTTAAALRCSVLLVLPTQSAARTSQPTPLFFPAQGYRSRASHPSPFTSAEPPPKLHACHHPQHFLLSAV